MSEQLTEEKVHYVDPERFTIVTKQHPLAAHLYTPRVEMKLPMSFLESVKDGIQQPVLAFVYRPETGDPQLIVYAGRQRVKAAQYLKLKQHQTVTVPTIVREIDNLGALKQQIIENSQRTANDFITKATEARNFVGGDGMRVEEVAKAFGVTGQTIHNWINIMDLPEPVIKAVQAEKISPVAALQLAKSGKRGEKLPDDQIIANLKAVLTQEVESEGKKVKVREVKEKTIDPTKTLKPSGQEIRALLKKDNVPSIARLFAQYILGDINLQQTKTLAQAEGLNFDWLVKLSSDEIKPPKAKKSESVVEDKPKKTRQSKTQKKAAQQMEKEAAFPGDVQVAVEEQVETKPVSSSVLDDIFG